jgi:hypothetical protein
MEDVKQNYAPIYLEGLRKTMTISVRIAGVLAETQTRHLLNTSQGTSSLELTGSYSPADTGQQ